MANTKSAKKAIRVSKRKAVINLRQKRSYKDAAKEALKVATKGSKKNSELINKAYKEIDKAAKRNIIHKNTAARYKSQLAKKAVKA
jgi:small subunit ribosomal protein S20